MQDGYIKYQSDWQIGPSYEPQLLNQLIFWRQKFYHLGLIGVDSQGVGYGNLSQRWYQGSQFVISGTQTGGLPVVTTSHYTLVTAFNLQTNSLSCLGPIQASSEALTHGALYQANQTIQAVIHVHHRGLWQKLMNKLPTTAVTTAYGTPAMAASLASYAQTVPQLVVMAGHEDGLISFGATLEEAATLLLYYYHNTEVC